MNARKLAADFFAAISSFNADALNTATIEAMHVNITDRNGSIDNRICSQTIAASSSLIDVSRHFTYLHPHVPPLWLHWAVQPRHTAATSAGEDFDRDRDRDRDRALGDADKIGQASGDDLDDFVLVEPPPAALPLAALQDTIQGPSFPLLPLPSFLRRC